MNLISAIFGALTVYYIFLIIKYLTNSIGAAWFGSLSLMVSHSFWLHSVIAEVYVVNAFFLAILTYISILKPHVRFFYFIFPLLFLLGVLNHLILFLTLPAFLLFFWLDLDKNMRIKTAILAFAMIVGAAGLISSLWVLKPQLIIPSIKSILIGPPAIWCYLLPPDSITGLLREVVYYILYLVYQFPMMGVILIVIGMVRIFIEKRNVSILLLLIILFNAFFFIKTTMWSSAGGTKYTFYISDYVIFSIFLAYGGYWLYNRMLLLLSNTHQFSLIRNNMRSSLLVIGVLPILATISFYAIMPKAVDLLHLDIVKARKLAYRNNNEFFLNPNKRGYRGNRKLGEEIFKSVKTDSIILADFTIYTVLEYLQLAEGSRPDVKIVQLKETHKVFDYIESIKKKMPDPSDNNIYIADKNPYYDLSDISEDDIVPRGSVFEIMVH